MRPTGAALEDLTAHVYIPITKVVDNDDGTVTVVGRPTTGEVDFDGQIMDPDFVREKFPQWFNEWGNIRVMHRPEAVGKGIDLAFDDEGPIMAAKIIEPTAAKLVREGVYKGYSVGVAHVKTKYDPKAPKGRIYDGEFFETSLVDRPSAAGAKLVIAKAAGVGEIEDVQTGEVHKIGNVHDPTSGNSVDFDSQGNPVLQPGHIQNNAARVQVVSMDDRAVIVRIGDEEWIVPFKMHDGQYEFGAPEPYPHDGKAQTEDPRNKDGEQPEEVGSTGKTATKGVWSTEEINDLPDSAFAYIEPGGEEKDGKTEPRSKRHLPYKNADGKVDAPHVRDALSRLPQTDIPEEAKAEARRKLEAAAKEVGVEVKGEDEAKKAALLKAAQDAIDQSAYCPHCKKVVQLQADGPTEVRKVADASGSVMTKRGVCGHLIHKFVADDHKGHEHEDEQHCPTCDKAVKVAEHNDDHTACKGECGHMVKCVGETDEADKGVGTGDDDPAKENGGEHGEHHAGEGAAESQERDIAKRLREAVDHYAAANTGDGGAEEGNENRALAELRELVNAAIAQQQREAVGEGRQDTQAEGANKSADEAMAETVAKVALEVMGTAPGPDFVAKVAKKIKGERLERLKAVHGHLGSLIDELKDAVEAADEPGEGDATGKAAAYQPNGGPAPVEYDPKAKKPKDVLERIRTGISELDELLREVARAEGVLAGGDGKVGNLGLDSRPVADTNPTRQRIDLTRGDGSERLMHGAGEGLAALEHVVTKAAKNAVAGLEQSVGSVVKSALAEATASLVSRLEVVEHMAAPMTRADAYVAQERQSVLDTTTEAQRRARQDLRAQIAQLPPAEREQFAALVLAAGGMGR